MQQGWVWDLDDFVVNQIGVRSWRGWTYLVEAMAEFVPVNKAGNAAAIKEAFEKAIA